MNAQRWAEVRARFDELVELDPPVRVARLKQIPDSELREAVESLLAADADVDRRLDDLESFVSVSAEADPISAPSDPFGLTGRTLSHFRVLGPLEAGGMGMVYRAEDTRLHRTVALKFLLPQYHLDSSAKERFLHEARSAAALDHSNLCTIHEVGESQDGRLFMAMALYPGETLRSRLARDGARPMEEALEIARQIALGLAYAHEAGIVHRDLKPGNVMLLPNGTVKILDFGLAKATDLSLTGSGSTSGTVAYMAPEQIQGRAVDGRADLWALGVVLYEMLTGKRPFGGMHEISMAHAIVHHHPTRPSKLRSEIAPKVEALVLSLLRKDREKRLATAKQFLDELAAIQPERGPLSSGRRAALTQIMGGRGAGSGRKRTLAGMLAGTAIALFAAAGLMTWEVWGSDTVGVPMARSIAVMRFENRSGDRESSDYLAGGLHDDVITQLARVGDLRVMSLTSMLRYRGAEKPVRQVGQELGVDAVLTGTVERSGERVQVTARLLDARTNEPVWTESYDREYTDLYAIPPEIAEGITRSLRARLTAAERAGIELVLTRSPEAYMHYHRGRERQRQGGGEEGFRAAERLFQAAVDADPRFALAHIGLASMHMKLYNFGFDRTEARRTRWRAAAETALLLQPELPEAHLSMGLYWFWGDLDFERGREQLDIARQGMPGEPEPREAMAYLLRKQWRWEESLAELQEAIKLDPLNPALHNQVAYHYAEVRDYPRALRAYDRVIALAPDNYTHVLGKAWLFVLWQGRSDSLAAALQRLPSDWDPDGAATLERVQLAFLQGRPEDALSALEGSRHQVINVVRVNAPTVLLRAQAYAKMGDSVQARADFEAARTHLERAMAATPKDGRLHVALAQAHAGLGWKDEAIGEALQAEMLVPISRDHGPGAGYMEAAARIFTQLGENQAALSRLDSLLRIPFGTRVSAARLRIDPIWNPLRSDPHFQRLLLQGEER